MYQGTTPIIPIRIKGADLTNARVFVSIMDEKNSKNIITFTSDNGLTIDFDGVDTVGSISLTQAQTLSMTSGTHVAQARWVFQDGTAGATKKIPVIVHDVILKGEIHYEDESD